MNLQDTVSTIMTPNVITVTPSQKILDLKHIYESQRFHHHVPVIENGILVGIVSLIDFMRVISGASLDDDEKVYHEKTVRDIMSLNPIFVEINTPIKAVADILAKGEIRSVLVTDNSQLKGIVTTADIIRKLILNK